MRPFIFGLRISGPELQESSDFRFPRSWPLSLLRHNNGLHRSKHSQKLLFLRLTDLELI
jgi:hypothetical protein